MPLVKLKKTVPRHKGIIMKHSCCICNIALQDGAKPTWTKRSGRSGAPKYYCNTCKKEKFSGVLLHAL